MKVLLVSCTNDLCETTASTWVERSKRTLSEQAYLWVRLLGSAGSVLNREGEANSVSGCMKTEELWCSYGADRGGRECVHRKEDTKSTCKRMEPACEWRGREKVAILSIHQWVTQGTFAQLQSTQTVSFRRGWPMRCCWREQRTAGGDTKEI